MMKLFKIFLMLSFIGGCKEFYDEDYKNFESTNDTISNEDPRNTSYFADLKTTDLNAPNLKGSARIIVQNDEVKMNLSVSGIPSNLIQLHYTYLNIPCGALSIAIPNDNMTTRSYQINETTSLLALENDLRSSGASSGENDINLLGKSVIVKAFANFAGIPNVNGTNQISILCGEVKLETTMVSDEVFNDVPAEEF
jgi:phage gpG-like protein